MATVPEPPVTELALLAAWEDGRGRPGPRRAVALAALVSGRTADEVADLPLGQCDLLLLRLREECFGPHMDALAQCPSCGTDLDVAIDLAELQSPPHSGVTERAFLGTASLPLKTAGRAMRLRALTLRDLLECGIERARLLARCVVDDGADDGGPAGDLGAAEGEPALLDAIEAQLDILDPQGAVGIDLACPECGASWRAPVDITELVWSEVDRFARRLLFDVHALASAYGWTEADVLAVSPARRRFYLQECAS